MPIVGTTPTFVHRAAIALGDSVAGAGDADRRADRARPAPDGAIASAAECGCCRCWSICCLPLMRRPCRSSRPAPEGRSPTGVISITLVDDPTYIPAPADPSKTTPKERRRRADLEPIIAQGAAAVPTTLAMSRPDTAAEPTQPEPKLETAPNWQSRPSRCWKNRRPRRPRCRMPSGPRTQPTCRRRSRPRRSRPRPPCARNRKQPQRLPRRRGSNGNR